MTPTSDHHDDQDFGYFPLSVSGPEVPVLCVEDDDSPHKSHLPVSLPSMVVMVLNAFSF